MNVFRPVAEARRTSPGVFSSQYWTGLPEYTGRRSKMGDWKTKRVLCLIVPPLFCTQPVHFKPPVSLFLLLKVYRYTITIRGIYTAVHRLSGLEVGRGQCSRRSALASNQ